jgi:membrane-bound lytic murein transglycosylase F
MTLFKKIAITISISSIIFFLIISNSLLTSCSNNQGTTDKSLASEISPQRFRIQEIQDRGRLIAITDYNSTDYFIYRGEPMGFQYEKLKMFADYLGVGLEIKVANSLDQAFRELEIGDVDLIAMGLTVTADRAERMDFTEPILQTRQMLVQRKPANWRKMRTWDDIEKTLIRNPLQLGAKTIYVQDGSAYVNRLNNLSEEIGKPITVIEDPLREVEQLVDAVAKGEIQYTICDENLANFYEKIYPELDIKTAVSFPQNLAWAVRQDADSLESVINSWLKEFNNTVASRYLIEKYYNSPRTAFMAKSEHVSFNGGKISRYDKIMRDLSKKYDFDWRLLASLVYQESQFHPDVKAWSGAYGLMQLMPATAAMFGIDSTSTDKEQLEAGIRYIKVLDGELPKDIKDPDERIKFILASYNLGIAHVFDARRLAEKNGKDPNIWTDNVDYFILNKSNPEFYKDTVVKFGYAKGEEAYNFVIEVLDRFEHYKNVIDD